MGRYNFNQRTRDGYEISPEQAAKWLERNDNNRNVNVAKVKKMAKDIGILRIRVLPSPPMARWLTDSIGCSLSSSPV